MLTDEDINSVDVLKCPSAKNCQNSELLQNAFGIQISAYLLNIRLISSCNSLELLKI